MPTTSPYTGRTRADWERSADQLLLAVRPYASPRHGRIDLPGPRPSWSGPLSDGLEGYARTWLLAAFRIAGARGEDPHGFLGRYAEGLAAGTSDPAGGPDAWPGMAGTPRPSSNPPPSPSACASPAPGSGTPSTTPPGSAPSTGCSPPSARPR